MNPPTSHPAKRRQLAKWFPNSPVFRRKNGETDPNNHLVHEERISCLVPGCRQLQEDSVGFVKALFRAFGRKKSRVGRLFGRDRVKGAYFAFISILDTGLPKPTIGAGTNLRRSF
jgi:hypothetical protein